MESTELYVVEMAEEQISLLRYIAVFAGVIGIVSGLLFQIGLEQKVHNYMTRNYDKLKF